MNTFGHAKAGELGLSEADVEQAVHEVRRGVDVLLLELSVARLFADRL